MLKSQKKKKKIKELKKKTEKIFTNLKINWNRPDVSSLSATVSVAYCKAGKGIRKCLYRPNKNKNHKNVIEN